jgi:hypothetical protein
MVSFSFILSSTGVLFLAEYLRKKFPTQYDTFMSGFYFNAIFLYTQLQVLAKKSYGKFTKDYPNVHDKIQKIYNHIQFFVPREPRIVYEFVKDGEIVATFTEEQVVSPDFVVPSDNSYDFFIFSDYVNDCILKSIHRNIASAKSPTIPSSVKFILSEITIGIDAGIDKTIKISFATNKYSYLVKNNIIDKKFLKYFMKKHYASEIADNDRHLLQNYKLKIIDNDVVINIYDSSSQVVIFSDSYTILDDNSSSVDSKETNMVSDVSYERTEAMW